MKSEEIQDLIRNQARKSIKDNINQVDESLLGKATRGGSLLAGWAGTAASLGIGGLAAVAATSLTPLAIGLGGVVLSVVGAMQLWRIANRIDNNEFRSIVKDLSTKIEARDDFIKSIEGSPDRQEERQMKQMTKEIRSLGSRLNSTMTSDDRIASQLSMKEKEQLEDMVQAAEAGTLSFMTSR